MLGCAAFPHEPAVLAFLAAVGVGNALVDIGLFTLPARLAPEELLGRVFGIFESLGALTVALGSLVAPLLVAAVGFRGALVAAGLVSPVCVLVAWRRLRRIDGEVAARDREIAVLRTVPMLGVLPLTAIEVLAERAEPAVVVQGAPVFDQGERPDRFYVIAAGEADVCRDGHHVASLGPGDGFGEMALLGESRRTAKVQARSELHLRAVHGDDFVPMITGYAPAASEADKTIGRRLQENRHSGLRPCIY
jgi:hypothetical protein